MTVCIAAKCKYADKTALAMCSDWQGTKGDFIKSDSINKVRYLGSASIMIAGNATAADELLFRCVSCIQAFTETTDPLMADLAMQAYLQALRAAVAVHKKDRIKEYVSLSRP